MPEGRMAEIVGQSDGLGEVFVEAELSGDGAADLSDLQRVRQSRAMMIVCRGDEYLCFVHQASKRRRMDHTIAVALVKGPKWVRFLRVTAAAAMAGLHGIGCQHFLLAVQPVWRFKHGAFAGDHASSP